MRTLESVPAGDVIAFKELIDDRLALLVTAASPADLYDPVRFVLEAPGKRLRPTLVWLAAEMFGRRLESILDVALGVEAFHAFTLVHDDIMDNASERRGRPTVHTKWSAPAGILTGDYLLALSYRLVVQGSPAHEVHRVTRLFDEMVTSLCEGQAVDDSFSGGDLSDLGRYHEMIDRKTGALIQSCLQIGGVLGGAGESEIAVLGELGRALGRAFQIQDDLLDAVASDDRWGKSVGGDLVEGKQTYLLLRALELTEGEEQTYFEDVVRSGGVATGEVPAVVRRLKEAGALADAREQVLHYSSAAAGFARQLPAGPAVGALTGLIEQLAERVH